jgi:hypothetical protein
MTYRSIALFAALAALATPAAAQIPRSFFDTLPSQQTITTPQGMWTSLPQQEVGGYRYNTYFGPQGQMTMCSSTQVGNQTYTNCN